MELAKNQEHIVAIEGYGEGGMGVARIDGRVVFVHGALRGETCPRADPQDAQERRPLPKCSR